MKKRAGIVLIMAMVVGLACMGTAWAVTCDSASPGMVNYPPGTCLIIKICDSGKVYKLSTNNCVDDSSCRNEIITTSDGERVCIKNN